MCMLSAQTETICTLINSICKYLLNIIILPRSTLTHSLTHSPIEWTKVNTYTMYIKIHKAMHKNKALNMYAMRQKYDDIEFYKSCGCLQLAFQFSWKMQTVFRLHDVYIRLGNFNNYLYWVKFQWNFYI